MPKEGPAREAELRLGMLRSVQGELVHPPNRDGLDRWASRIDARSRFLKDTAWGTIRWEKSIGRSLGPTLASGFRGESLYLEINGADLGGGQLLNTSKWVPAKEEPLFWDMPDDGDQYRVGFLFWMVRPWYQEINLRFSEVAWDSPITARLRTTYRAVLSPQPFWVPDEVDYAVLDPATVVELAVRVFGP